MSAKPVMAVPKGGRKYLFCYKAVSHVGRIFVTGPRELTEETIIEWEMLVGGRKDERVVTTNIIPLEG